MCTCTRNEKISELSTSPLKFMPPAGVSWLLRCAISIVSQSDRLRQMRAPNSNYYFDAYMTYLPFHYYADGRIRVERNKTKNVRVCFDYLLDQLLLSSMIAVT